MDRCVRMKRMSLAPAIDKLRGESEGAYGKHIQKKLSLMKNPLKLLMPR